MEIHLKTCYPDTWFSNCSSVLSHWEDFVIDICISSSVRPLVSGTSNAVNRTDTPEMTANIENVPVSIANMDLYKHENTATKRKELEGGSGSIQIPVVLHCIMKLKAYVIIQLQHQWIKATRLPADPLTFIGNIWNRSSMGLFIDSC